MRTCSCILLALLLAAPAVGHELTGPTTFVADVQGHFSYNLTLTVTSPALFGSIHLDGSGNTDLMLWVDGYCSSTITGISVIWVEGNLIDDGANGTVIGTVNLCDPWTGVVTTTIVPFPVANEASTWGMVKSLYR
jgi:hypothetical protein